MYVCAIYTEVERPLNRLEYTLGPGLDLEFETEPQTSAPEPSMYETAYVTSHKDKCRAAAFTMDGNLVATGSVDASIKVSAVAAREEVWRKDWGLERRYGGKIEF